MPRMVLQLQPNVKRKVQKLKRQTRDNGLAMRCQIVLLRAQRYSRPAIAEAVGCSISWVDRVLRRFRDDGVSGLLDRREDNGALKLDEPYLRTLTEVVGGRPGDYGHRRPTWTRELLVKVMAKLTGVRVHVTTMSRALKAIEARRGRARPVVACPWSKAAQTRRIRKIHRLVETLPDDQVAVYADEVDLHLNPKIGSDWMNRGQQKTVLTPGQNVKRYIAGALDATTGRVTWVEGERKNSLLFIDLLHQLAAAHPKAKKIHVILDNCRVHHSRITQAAVEALGGRVVLHFLPPYCPQHNRIERLWLDLHAEVTRHHERATMAELMRDVRRFLRRRDRQAQRMMERAA